MRSLKIHIVEDEILIATTIKIYLEERGHEVVCISISYAEAINNFHEISADLLLLDIRLYGEKSGIHVAEYVKNQKNHPPFIFLTAQYDIPSLNEALHTNPYGYLTKPILKETLWTSIESAYHLFMINEHGNHYILIFDGQKNINIDHRQILFIQSDHVYSKIFLNDGQSILTRKPLTDLSKALPKTNFIQCHRSYIINKSFIKSWNNEIIFIKDIIIPISRTRKKIFLESMQLSN